MSLNYAAGLSHYDDLGVCGLDEVFDEPQVLRDKVKQLAGWLRLYEGSCVLHVGAGLSTAAGIPDFRGKRGVWTKMLNGEPAAAAAVKKEKDEVKLEDNATKPFDETKPTLGHMALRQLCEAGYVSHIISQNVDGLFLKANLERKFISELHGNFYLDECTKCKSRFIRSTASDTMRLTSSSFKCPRNKKQQQKQQPERQVCAGYLRDTILDWESPIPYNELRTASREAKRCKLHICIGTSMQLRPSKDLVCDPTTRKSSSSGNKLVVINLQPTQINLKASLVINHYADEVLGELIRELDLGEVIAYDPSEDPTKNSSSIGEQWKK